MLRSSIVFIVVVAIVGSNAYSDVTSILNQTNALDFLKNVAAKFSDILQQTVDQISSKVNAKMKARIRSFQLDLQKMDTNFTKLLKQGDSLKPPTNLIQTLRDIKALETLRDQYLNGTVPVNKFVDMYENLGMVSASDTLRKGFIVQNNERSIIAKFQTLTFNAPKEMDVVVKGIIQMRVRTDILYLTNALLKNSNQGIIDGILNVLPREMNQTIEAALNLLKKINQNMKIQMKADIKRHLAQKSVNVQHICDIAMILMMYFKNKYEAFDFAVIAYSNYHRSVASICQGAYGFRVAGLNAIVAIKEKTDAVRDINSWADRYIKSIPNISTKKKPHVELSKKIYDSLGDFVCSKTDLLAFIDGRDTACLKSSGRINHSMLTKQVTKCYDPLCWSKSRRNFRIYVIG